MDQLNLHRFIRLFRGNVRSYGRWDGSRPKDKQSLTEKDHSGFKPEVFDRAFQEHLDGGIGVGIVPVRDDGTTLWGAIDLDNHGQSADIDIRAVEKKVAAAGLPLVPCRSKSGGVHLYVFFSEPARADMVKDVLTRWARELQVDGVDCIYPKQGRLAVNSDGVRALGNWINLPYHGSAASNSDGAGLRFAVSNGKKLTLEAFLLHAESKSIDGVTLQKFFSDDLSELPPCLKARLQSGGFAPGERNEGVYQVAVFCRKRDPETSRDAAHDLVSRFMSDSPLSFKERDKTIRSAVGSRNSNYKCQNFQDVCDREACRKLKFGISEGEYENMSARATMPAFHSLVKFHNAEPMRFDLSVGDSETSRRIEGLTIDELVSFPELRKAVMAKTHVVLPRLKGDEWDKILRGLFESVTIEDVPEDSTPEGMVKTRLFEFLRKADLKSEGEHVKDRDALLRGVPVVQIHNDERVVMFRHVDFVAYLTKTRTDAIKNKDLWFKASRKMGVSNTRVRVGKTSIPVWLLPVSAVEQHDQTAADFTPEY
ncbi:MAG: hypothetical protein DDT26_00001 [Dehalococcoidia bacterium]|nr:hypothetical protein [Chloroflexota bacterium]